MLADRGESLSKRLDVVDKARVGVARPLALVHPGPSLGARSAAVKWELLDG